MSRAAATAASAWSQASASSRARSGRGAGGQFQRGIFGHHQQLGAMPRGFGHFAVQPRRPAGQSGAGADPPLQQRKPQSGHAAPAVHGCNRGKRRAGQGFQPEGQPVLHLVLGVDLLPAHGADQAGFRAKAAMAPELIELHRTGRPMRVVVRADHRAEGGEVATGQAGGMRLTRAEEIHARTATAIGGQQHRLAEITEPPDIPAPREKRRDDAGALGGKRPAGGTAHQPIRHRRQRRGRRRGRRRTRPRCAPRSRESLHKDREIPGTRPCAGVRDPAGRGPWQGP